MLIVEHRINTKERLAQVPPEHGVEIDLRCEAGELVLRHDAVGPAESFEGWLDGYHHALLIANVKEEGLETLVLTALATRGIAEFFFLDQSVPFLVKTTARGEARCAVRVSEYEATKLATKLAGKARWVWLDCFLGGPPITAVDAGLLRAYGYRLCVVSPELHAPEREAEVPDHVRWARQIGADAVCTKLPEAWGSA